MSLPSRFTVTLHFLSDWHIGTGQGRLGTIDADVRRDVDGLPFVPAKTLIGVWRDACETVADTLDQPIGQPAGGPGPWQAWVTWLFGSQPAQTGDPTARADRPPVPAALRLTSARAPAWLGARVHNRRELAQAAVVLRPGVSIDEDTGTAADRLLRVEERSLRDTRLHAHADIEHPGPLPEPAELLLRAGARLVEAVGGKRNRGTGRVAVLLPDVTLDRTGTHPAVTDARLTSLLLPLLTEAAPATPPPAPTAHHPIHSYDRLHHSGQRTVRVVLRTVTPVVAAEKVLSNVITSGDAIPGTALLGTILSRTDLPRPDGTSGPIGLGDIRVGDAVPAVSDPENPDDPSAVIPSQPVPAMWRRGDKGRSATVHNVLAAPDAGRDERAKPMTGRIAPDGTGWRLVATAQSVSTHAVVDDDARRPTATGGGVYTYVGIAPGTLLCTDIVLPADARLRLTAGEQLRFGRSRKDDFGLVTVAAVHNLPAPAEQAAVTAGPIQVWCLSDVLLRDDRLAPDPSPQALARALSTALAPAVFTADPAATATSATRREGFGVAWGRPRPSQVALRAGSVITFTMTGAAVLDRGQVADLCRDGVGERTAEGYGRIRFNPPELAATHPRVAFPDAAQAHKNPIPAVETTADPGGGPGPDPHPVELNAWRRAIRRASAGLPPEALIAGVDRLADKRAQLGSLRAQLERLALPGGPDLVRAWLTGTRAVPARQEAWGEQTLDDLETLLLVDPGLIWHRLGLDDDQDHLVLAAGRATLLRERLRTEALTVAVTDALRHLNRDLRTTVRSTSSGERHP
ncbi:RAMP superfamily CRISPR-associated protein [Dactylosporangium sp. NPDC005555]|uniref:RAMP superfamily CRISPR-associated protein n=1 Tax=Dactylosporangium sp. NPDC005555 TaxID=3154889 RepID=UPI0033AB9F85